MCLCGPLGPLTSPNPLSYGFCYRYRYRYRYWGGDGFRTLQLLRLVARVSRFSLCAVLCSIINHSGPSMGTGTGRDTGTGMGMGTGTGTGMGMGAQERVWV